MVTHASRISSYLFLFGTICVFTDIYNTLDDLISIILNIIICVFIENKNLLLLLLLIDIINYIYTFSAKGLESLFNFISNYKFPKHFTEIIIKLFSISYRY